MSAVDDDGPPPTTHHPRAALAFLVRVSIRNRLRRQLLRLRQPRYVVALLIGIIYFGFLFLPDDTPDRPATARALLEILAPLLVALYLAWAWLWGGHRRALAFTPAEVQHLFSAPVSRRDLIRFQLLRSQLRIAFSAAFFTLLLDDLVLPWWLRLPTLWVLLSTIQLHQIAASLVHAGAETQGASGARRNVVAIVLFAAMGGALLWSIFRALPELGAPGPVPLPERIGAVLRGPIPAVALAPFRLLLGPILAPDAGAWARALPGALALLLLHYLWVLRTDTAFEEAAAEAAQRRADRVAALRAGRRTAGLAGARPRAVLFPLRPGARPWTALVWKNLIAFARGLRRNTLGFALILLPFTLILALAASESAQRAASGLGQVALILAGMLLALGPLAIRNDLRQDLARISLLRTWPLPGRAIVGAEVASAALVLSTAGLVLVAISLAAFTAARALPPSVAIALFGAALLVMPPLNALALVVQNGLALHFPDWMRIGADQPGGVEFMGQHILRLAGSMLLLAAGLVPPLLLAGWVVFQLLPVLGSLAAGPAAFCAILGLWLEVALVLAWLGRAFERIDFVEAGLRG